MLPVLRPVALRPRQILHHAGTPMEHAYFIEKGLISVSAWCTPGRWVEVWLFGREGICGIPVVLGDHDEPPLRRMVQVGGSALQISRYELRRFMDESAALRSLLLKFAQVVLLRSSQSSACNATHTVTQRLSRWLLLARESLGEDSIPLTHQVLSRLLGVRRATVTECMTVLEREGAIDRSRGRLVVVDASKLESISCDCHRRIRREYDRLVGVTGDR